MNEFKFDFDYIKKNCNQKKLLKDTNRTNKKKLDQIIEQWNIS